jgi:hypothetical protein
MPHNIYPFFKFEGYSTIRTHTTRQSVDATIGSVGSPCELRLADGSNQNILGTICFRDSLSLVDRSIEKICQKTCTQPASHSSPTSHSSLPSTDNGSPQSPSDGSLKSSGTHADSAPSTSYWESSQARNLFQPQPKETVEDCLKCRCKILKAAYSDWSKLVDILDGGVELLEKLTDDLKQLLVQKCLYLCRAYQAALQSMDNGTNRSASCQMVIDEIANLDSTTYWGVSRSEGSTKIFESLISYQTQEPL